MGRSLTLSQSRPTAAHGEQGQGQEGCNSSLLPAGLRVQGWWSGQAWRHSVQGHTNHLMSAFRAQKTQKGWEPGSFSQPHANEFPTRNVNSRQQRLRHAVIMVDSICKAWVPPPNFLLFCLRIRKGNPVDSIQLLPALGAPTPLLSRQTVEGSRAKGG